MAAYGSPVWSCNTYLKYKVLTDSVFNSIRFFPSRKLSCIFKKRFNYSQDMTGEKCDLLTSLMLNVKTARREERPGNKTEVKRRKQ